MMRLTVFALLALGSAAAPRQAGAADVPFCAGDANNTSVVHAAVESEARSQGIDANLALAIADQESRFGEKTQADGRTDKGARGPMQLMPTTALRFGVKDVCDLTQNVRGGVAYLKELSDQFGGNVLFIAAAYNAGEGRVLASKGVPPLAETVRYAASVANIYYRYDNILRGGSRSLRAANKQLHEPAVATPAADAPLKASGAGVAQKWIGGSVLYVEGDE